MKITKISFFILMVFCFTSCNKYLDQVPSEKLNEDVLFNSKDDVVKVLTQIYAYYPSPIQFPFMITGQAFTMLSAQASISSPELTNVKTKN